MQITESHRNPESGVRRVDKPGWFLYNDFCWCAMAVSLTGNCTLAHMIGGPIRHEDDINMHAHSEMSV